MITHSFWLQFIFFFIIGQFFWCIFSVRVELKILPPARKWSYAKNLLSRYQHPIKLLKHPRSLTVMYNDNDLTSDIQNKLVNRGILFSTKYVSERPLLKPNGKLGSIQYYSLEELSEILGKWLILAPHKLEVLTIGKTHEGRDIQVAHIKGANRDAPVVFLECGIHAREWASVYSCTYILDKLLNVNKYEELTQKYDVHLLLVMNPDGYDYTWKSNRNWRKNRRATMGHCEGVDLNRNFEVDFCEKGSSTDPCSEVFCGKNAFSEPESIALKVYLQELSEIKPIYLYLSIHSYGKVITFPFGYTKKRPPNYLHLKKKIIEVSENIQKYQGTGYKIGQTSRIIYPASGGSDDWVHLTLKPTYTFVIELRDTGRYGFIAPIKMSRDSAKDAFISILTILNYYEKV